MKNVASIICPLALVLLVCGSVEARKRKLRLGPKIRSDQSPRMRSRSLSKLNNDDLPFTRGYLAITPSEKFQTIFSSQNDADENPNSILGSSEVQAGGVYDPADIKIVNRPDGFQREEGRQVSIIPGNFPDRQRNFPDNGQLFAGNAQPKFVPDSDPGFQYNGQCVVTEGNGLSAITAHSCVFNLCLGGGGFNCLGLYSGTAFVFDPFDLPSVFRVEPQNFNSPVGIVVVGDTLVTNTAPNLVGDNISTNKKAPLLPPSFPFIILGGTGAFKGAKGTVDVTTITGRTSPLKSGRLIPFDEPEIIDFFVPQAGFITQRLQVRTNVPLPPAP